MSAADTINAAIALAEAGLSEARAEREQSASRLARCRAAQSLIDAGKRGEAMKLLRAVEREQKR